MSIPVIPEKLYIIRDNIMKIMCKMKNDYYIIRLTNDKFVLRNYYDFKEFNPGKLSGLLISGGLQTVKVFPILIH